MAGARTSAGTKLHISSAAPATYTSAGFAALTWTEIGEVTDLGEFGRQYNLVTHNQLASRRVVKRKGSYNDGTINAQMARVPADAGQVILQTAVNSDASYSIKITLQGGEIFYFSAQVMSYTTNIGGADQIVGATVAMEIDNDIIVTV